MAGARPALSKKDCLARENASTAMALFRIIILRKGGKDWGRSSGLPFNGPSGPTADVVSLKVRSYSSCYSLRTINK